MSENLKPPMPEDASSAVVSELSLNSGLSSDALARRRMLLKSLGKGGVVITAVVAPMHSLANGTALLTPTGNGGTERLRCSVSGMQSGVHSKSPASSQTCGGYSPGWWGQESSPNSGVPGKPWPEGYPNMPYSDKFTHDSLKLLNNKTPTLFQVMSTTGPDGYRDLPIWHWIGAFLNGFYQSSNNFPYSAQQILDFYNLSDGDKNRQSAYTLITTYLETHKP